MNSTAVPRGASEPFRQLRALRRARKLKQEDVARKAGISREAYLRAESGQADPRMSTFLAACEALGLEVVLAPQHLAADVNAFARERLGTDNRAFLIYVPKESDERGARSDERSADEGVPVTSIGAEG